MTTSAGASYNVNYYLDGNTIIAEDRNGTLIHYYYNQTGVIGMRYGGVDYLFLKDALGSITEIINSSGGIYAQYVYDAWGNTIYKSTGGLTDINPFRYRGYYMDTETGWYYLQTRYYDPVVRRFINADTYELIPYLAGNIGELNLYSYCNNNPVMYTDETGMALPLVIGAGAAIYYLIGLIAVGAVAVVEITTNIISNALDSAFTSLGNWIDSWGKKPISQTQIIEQIIGSVVVEYERKTPGIRDRSNTRKEAKEKAFQRGGK